MKKSASISCYDLSPRFVMSFVASGTGPRIFSSNCRGFHRKSESCKSPSVSCYDLSPGFVVSLSPAALGREHFRRAVEVFVEQSRFHMSLNRPVFAGISHRDFFHAVPSQRPIMWGKRVGSERVSSATLPRFTVSHQTRLLPPTSPCLFKTKINNTYIKAVISGLHFAGTQFFG